MPVIELDMLIGFVNRADRNHPDAVRLFDSVSRRSEAHFRVATSAYLEYELLHRSRRMKEAEIFAEISSFQSYPHLGETGLSARTVLRALLLREDHTLTYFDSLHAASALLFDGIILSTDRAYDEVEGLKRVDPSESS